MPGVQLRFTEEDKQQITEQFRELARFADGDKVTVESTDHDIKYAGQEYEGALLTVDDVFWNSSSLVPAPDPDDDRFRPADPNENYGEEHFVTLEGDYEYYIHDRVMLLDPEYTFREKGIHPMSESSLIPWEEYRADHDRMKLVNESPSDNETHWIEPFENGECEVCGCNMAGHWYYDNGIENASGHECAACGDLKESHGI